MFWVRLLLMSYAFSFLSCRWVFRILRYVDRNQKLSDHFTRSAFIVCAVHSFLPPFEISTAGCIFDIGPTGTHYISLFSAFGRSPFALKPLRAYACIFGEMQIEPGNSCVCVCVTNE